MSVESLTYPTNSFASSFEYATLLVREGWVSLGNANRSGISSKWWNCYPEGIRFRFLCFDGREYSESVVFSADACLYGKREKLHGINVVSVDGVFIWAGNESFVNLHSLMHQSAVGARCCIYRGIIWIVSKKNMIPLNIDDLIQSKCSVGNLIYKEIHLQ